MILRFLLGAAIPFVSYTPMVNSGGSQQTSQTNTKLDAKQESPLERVYDALKDSNMLPSDVEVIYGKIADLERKQSGILNTGITTREIIALQGLIEKAKFYSKEYENAYKAVLEKGGLEEFAVTDRGMLVGYNPKTNDYKFLDFDSFIKLDEYKALTNSELLSIRRDSLPFNTSLLQTVKNGVGIEAINKMILDVVNKLGTSTVSKEGYYDSRIKKGINILQEAIDKGLTSVDELSVKGLYKNNLISESLAAQINLALDYMIKTLPNNVKTILQVKAYLNNVTVLDLLVNLIASTSSSKLEFSTDLLKNKDGEILGDKINLAVALQTDLGDETILPINAGTPDTLYLTAYSLPVMTKEGKPLGITSLKLVANESALSGILNFSQVTMGNLSVDMSALNSILVDATSIYKVYLPYDLEAAAKGIIKPNLEYIAKLQAIRQEIKKRNITDPNEINKVYEKHKLPKFIDEEGKVNIAFYKPFGVMNGTAFSKAFDTRGSDLSDKYFEELHGERARNVYNQLNAKGSSIGDFDEDDWGIFEGGYDTIVKGLVFIPMRLNPVLGSYSGGDTPSSDLLMELNNAYKQNERAKNINLVGQL